MSKGPFGLRRFSDALDMLTPKKFRRRYRPEDEEDFALTPLRATAVEEEIISEEEVGNNRKEEEEDRRKVCKTT